jgi:hypothetical protein
MKKDITRLVKTLLIAIAMLVAVDITVGVVSDRLMDKLPDFSGDLAKDNYRLRRLETDVVIIGSSRGSGHYVTSLLGDSLDAYYGEHLSIYNASIAGKRANSNSCAAEVLIERYRPQLVIYDIFEKMICDPRVDDIEFSAPYYWKDTIVRRYLDDIGLRERILMKSSLYRYNGKLFRIASTIANPEAPNDGYEPNFGQHSDLAKNVDNDEEEISMPTEELDSYVLKHFEDVLRKYSSEKIPLVIVCSPRFCPKDNNKRLAAICDQYGVPFLDFYDTPYFNEHPELFRDGKHMNDDGAHVFSAMLIERLKPYL